MGVAFLGDLGYFVYYFVFFEVHECNFCGWVWFNVVTYMCKIISIYRNIWIN